MLLVVSILIGVTTHVLWDSFTHSDYWLYRHWHLLHEKVNVPLFGPRPLYGIFQYMSSLAGILIIVIWFMRWYRNTQPVHAAPDPRRLMSDRIALTCAFAVALLLGLFRAAEIGIPHGVDGSQRFMTKTVITAITVFCSELLVYGLVRNFRRATMHAS